eukprot:5394634-Amphidinium_carterae.1
MFGDCVCQTEAFKAYGMPSLEFQLQAMVRARFSAAKVKDPIFLVLDLAWRVNCLKVEGCSLKHRRFSVSLVVALLT